MAYYDLFLAQKLTGVFEESKSLLQQFIEISESVYKVGKGRSRMCSRRRSRSRAFWIVSPCCSAREKRRRPASIRCCIAPRRLQFILPSEIPKPKLAYTLDQLYRKAAENNPWCG